MRTVLVLCLIHALSFCPAFCGTDEADHVTHPHQQQSGDSPATPVHCPEDGDGCICNGAIQTADVRLPDMDSIGLFLPVNLSDVSASHPPLSLTWNRATVGLTGWGDSNSVRSFLQNFRC